MNNKENNYELIKFEDVDFSLDVKVAPNEDTVWLNAQEIGLLFERDYKTILKHITNIFKEKELIKESNSQKLRLTGNDKPTIYYTLDVIISIGYRVKSKRGIILKQYLLNGYAINKDRVIAYQSNTKKVSI